LSQGPQPPRPPVARVETSGVSTNSTSGASAVDKAEERFTHVTRNSSIMAIGTFGSRILGFVRTYLFTQVVAASVAADAYTQAHNLPTQLFIIISTGVVNGVLIPQITKAMRRPDGGDDFVNRLLTLSVIVIFGVALVTTLATPWLINMIVSSKANVAVPGYLRLAILLGYWCMPQVFFYGMFAVLGQVLNARGHFTAFAWAPALANVVQIAGLVWFWIQWGKQPDANWTIPMIVVIGATSTGGVALQALMLIWPLRRDGFRFKLRFGWRGYGFGDVSRMTLWTLAAVMANVATAFVISWAATATRGGVADNGGNAVQQYAYSLFILPHSMIMVSIATALFPAMATAWNSADFGRMKDLVRQGLTQPAVLLIPASLGLIGIGAPVIHTLYGGLNATEATNVWWVTAAYSIGLWPFGIQALRQRYYFAKQDGLTNFWLVIIQSAAQLAAALIAVWLLPERYGIVAIALGLTLGSLAATVIYLIMMHRDLGSFGLRPIMGLWGKLTVASAAAAFAGWDVVQAMSFASTSRALAPVQLVASGLVFCVVFYVVSWLLPIEPVTSLVRSVVDRLLRRSKRTAAEQASIDEARAIDALGQPNPSSMVEYTQPLPPPQPWLRSGAPAPKAPPDPRDLTSYRGLNR